MLEEHSTLNAFPTTVCTAPGSRRTVPACGGPEGVLSSIVSFPPSPDHNHKHLLWFRCWSLLHVCPCGNHARIIICCYLAPPGKRWWQTSIATPMVFQTQTFRLQFNGSGIPISCSLKLTYLVSNLWSALWGCIVLCRGSKHEPACF